MRRTLALIAALIATASCGDGRDAGADRTPDEGFIRLPAQGSDISAAYFSIVGETDDRLIAASVEGVERTELHTVIEEDGIMKMRPVDGYAVRAGEPLVLEPGGNHLMLFGLDTTLMGGETRKVTLTFESGAKRVIELPVRHQGGMGSH